MTVINPNSISGITSITLPSGDSNVLTVHTNDGVERFRIDSSGNVKVGSAATISPDGDLFVTGVCTATTLAGAASGLTGTLPAISGANLTNLPAANITGTLPAISAANLTSIPAANITGTLPAISATNLTNVPAANITGTLPAISGANLTNLPASGKATNLVINGAMNVAQRATSSTSSTNGYNSVDRWGQSSGGDDEAPTQAQVDVSSGTTPYTLGFRKSYRITNGNQTSGAGAADYYRIYQGIEAQDLANSGWNYTSSSSYVTLSFWVKSSVAQNFYGDFRTQDGTSQSYPFETGSLSANTWTKITKTIPGHSNITVTNDNGVGAYIFIVPFHGTDYTGSVTLNQWGAYSSSARTPDMTSTWWTTNDATFEITGVLLEVGDSASDYPHRSFGAELYLCQRYFELIRYEGYVFYGYQPSASSVEFFIHWNVEKRDNPTITLPTTGTGSGQINPTNYQGSNLTGGSLDGPFTIRQTCARVSGGSWSNGTAGAPCALYTGGSTGIIKIESEL